MNKEELIKADLEEKTDLEKEIIRFIDENPKSSLINIMDWVSGWGKDFEDISDILSSLTQEGICYKNYGYYCLTDYGNNLLKLVILKLIIFC